MKKTTFFSAIFIGLTLLQSCNSKQEERFAAALSIEAPNHDGSYNFSSPAAADAEENSHSFKFQLEPSGDKSVINKKKIIKDGNITVKTYDINASKKGIDELLKKLNGYYDKEDFENNDQVISFDLKIRVPAENFEKLISGIENGQDEIKSKSIQARDVTEEFIDIETRLANKREYLKRYKELLSRASTVKDILAIEENVRTLQEEIESKEGRLRYLSDQVSFSTLDINLFKQKEFVYKPQQQDKFSERVKKSLSYGWTSVVNFILVTIGFWPYITLTFVAIFVIRRVIKKRKDRQS